jgi:hypothetical protein
MTWKDLESLCVTNFPLSQSRRDLLAGFRRVIGELVAQGIEGDIWVNGSFVTRAIEPRDVDFALRIDLAFLRQLNQAQRNILNWMAPGDKQAREQMKNHYRCDPYVFAEIPPADPEYPGKDMRQYWLTQFGFDRSRNPKGIAVLSIPGGVG